MITRSSQKMSEGFILQTPNMKYVIVDSKIGLGGDIPHLSTTNDLHSAHVFNDISKFTNNVDLGLISRCKRFEALEHRCIILGEQQ